MNKKDILIGTCIIGSLAGIGVLAYYLYRREKEEIDVLEDDNVIPTPQQEFRSVIPKNQIEKSIPKPTIKPKPNPEARPILEQPKPSPKGDEFPLRLGSRGKRVERLQIWLLRNYGWTGKITQEFDLKTEALLQRYLKKKELYGDTYYRLKMEKPVYEQSPMR